MALANLSIYYTWKNIKPSYNKNKFQLQLGDGYYLPDGYYSFSDIQELLTPETMKLLGSTKKKMKMFQN